MALIYEDQLKRKLKEGLSKVYVLFGEDGFLKKTYTEKISKLACDTDDVFNYLKLGDGCDLQNAYDFILQLPFMSDKKCLVLWDYDFEECSKTDFERLCALISEVPDDAVLILYFDSVQVNFPKSSRFKKIVDTAGKNGGLAVRLDHKKTPELIKILTDGAKKRGCSLDSNTAKYLIQTAGEDINVLRNELDKLCAFVKGGVIDNKTVDNVSVKTVESSVYRLAGYILQSDINKAFSILDELVFMRIEPFIILYSISSVYVDMYRVFQGARKGIDISQIANDFSYGKRDFVLEQASYNLRRMDENKLTLSLEAIVDADSKLKSFGADSKIVLQQLIVKLIYIIAKGESVD